MAKFNKNAIVASRILGLDGKVQSPILGDQLWREFLWPKQLFPKLFKQPSFIENIEVTTPIYVNKIMGCCMILKRIF